MHAYFCVFVWSAQKMHPFEFDETIKQNRGRVNLEEGDKIRIYGQLAAVPRSG